MTQVTIELPSELLRRLDDEARRRGTTRSGMLRALVERELAEDPHQRERGIRALLMMAGRHGDNVAAHVRAAGPRRPSGGVA
ncbi:MAG TPA: ribbon-helix-helix protein, CopG family [Capillimicrobium sp.]|nr:ribbon-helix-helix protein, CopG family [Capillimicrobium sp.]